MSELANISKIHFDALQNVSRLVSQIPTRHLEAFHSVDRIMDQIPTMHFDAFQNVSRLVSQMPTRHLEAFQSVGRIMDQIPKIHFDAFQNISQLVSQIPTRHLEAFKSVGRIMDQIPAMHFDAFRSIGQITIDIHEFQSLLPSFNISNMTEEQLHLDEVEWFFNLPELTTVRGDTVKLFQTAIQRLRELKGKLPPEVLFALTLAIQVLLVPLLQSWAYGPNQTVNKTEIIRNTNIEINLNFPKPDNSLRIVNRLTTIHRNPKGKSQIAELAYCGDCIQVLEARKKWRLVRFHNGNETIEGWVLAKYLDKTKPLSRHWRKNNTIEQTD